MEVNGPADRRVPHDLTHDERGCPDAERLAEYADGVLDPAARLEVEAHLSTCADCRAVLVETMAYLDTLEDSANVKGAGSRTIPFRQRRWLTGLGAGLAAAAALVLIVRFAAPAWLPGFLGGARDGTPELQALVAAVNAEPARPVEARLMGGFAYAPPPSVTRSGGGPGLAGRRSSPGTLEAAARIAKLAEGQESARLRARLGVAFLVTGSFDDAIDALRQASSALPDDAAVWTDLSAAYLARARWTNRTEDWQSGLDAAERAAGLDPAALEPLFNKALALDGLQLNDRARQAWADYLARDKASAWAREAAERQHLLEQR